MGTKPRDPQYWAKWRARHPEYRARERTRRQEWKRTHRAQVNASEQARRRRRRAEVEELPPFAGHELFDEVAPLLPPERRGAALRFANEVDREDALMDAIVARLEGRDPVAAIRRTFADAKAWASRMTRFLDEDAHGPWDES